MNAGSSRRLGATLAVMVAMVFASPGPPSATVTALASDAHWAFQPVVRPTVPTVAAPGASGNPIDAFVGARLAAAGLTFSPEADRTTLIRRLWFVMLGLPPTPEETDAFLADAAPDAFARLVERALADPRYGERFGRHWLDVIRFAESNGFETNRERPNAWRFRDYVIEAFRADLPYDRFVREQLAGDALGADIATGFLVAGPVDIVASPDPVLTAKQRADEVDDMVATTSTAFLGLTVGCARCHAHKFDPISHREYHAMAAIFAGVRHGERALPLPAERAAEVARVDARIAALAEQLAPFAVPPPGNARAARPPVAFARNEETFAPRMATRVRFSIFATSGAEPCLDELEVWAGDQNVALASHGTVATASGTLAGYAIHQLAHVHDGEVGNDHSWIADEAGGGWVQLAFPRPERIERIVWGRDRLGRVRDRLATRYRIEVAREDGRWEEIVSSADRVPLPDVQETRARPSYRFEGSAPGSAGDVEARGRARLADLDRLQRKRRELAAAPMAYAGTFVEPGPTRRFHRGDPMQPREEVAPGTLALFRPLTLAPDAPERERRVALADWIVHPEHPLTARVLVNRIWQYHFGAGLVSTPNDFGKNGASPTHPELLDWLAAEFVARGWSIKTLQRQILTSATWRQASAPRAAALRVDAGSRLLWRFPPRRLEAEAIRDSILAVSGALDASAGGPSFPLHDVERENVYHYQPKEDFGPAEARRMVYALKVRMEQDAIFGAFDCPDGSLVVPRRSTSTTPIQALNLFNSRFVLQQAQAFAARVRADAGEEPEAMVERAWRLAFGRAPAREEVADAAAFVRAEGLLALARALLNANEFLFIP